MSRYYIYELWNPIKNQPFYVGKGTMTIDGKYKRIYDHIREAKTIIDQKTKNKHKTNTILKILREGYEIDHRIVFETDVESEAYDKEKELIKKYGRLDIGTGILTNLSDGGDGAGSGWKMPEWLIEIKC